MRNSTIPAISGLIMSLFFLNGCKVESSSELMNKTAASATKESVSSYSVRLDEQPLRSIASSTVTEPRVLAAVSSISIDSSLPPIPGTWSMIFEDEFSGDALDPDKWRLGGHHLGIAGIGGNSSSNVVVRDGNVELIAEKRPMLFGSKAYDYAGAEISTYQTFSQAYGYFEARMKYDAVQGVWPAFWLMPDRGNYGKAEHQHESFLRFDLNDYSQPVTSALLKVRVTNIDRVPGHERERNKTNYNLSVHKLLSDDWDEDSITWNNKPAYDPLWFRQFSASVNGPELVNEIAVGEDIVIDITDYINAQIATGKQAGLVLVDTFRKQKQVTLGSKEAVNYSDQPRLEIDGNMLTPSDDAYVRAGDDYADTNFGEESELAVKTPWKNTSATDDGGMEIDIMESLGIWGEDKTQYAMHWDYYGQGHPTISSQLLSLQSSNDGYHTYGMNWQPGHIDFYIDGVKTWEHVTDRVSSVASYMLLSQQLGGWAGNANIPDGFMPAAVYVDYVRVWSGSASE